jgi:hypothetical protein
MRAPAKPARAVNSSASKKRPLQITATVFIRFTVLQSGETAVALHLFTWILR